MTHESKEGEDYQQAREEVSQVQRTNTNKWAIFGAAALLLISVAIVVVGLMITFTENQVFSDLQNAIRYIVDHFDKTDNMIYLFTGVLVVAYFVVLLASFLYADHLSKKYNIKYNEYKERHKEHNIPRIFTRWILPVISILLVLVSQVVVLSNSGSAQSSSSIVVEGEAEIQTDGIETQGHNLYSLIFVMSTALVLLMIGMELAYTAQERQEGHRWLALVTVSLILDFVSYILLISGFEALVMHLKFRGSFL